MNLHVISIVFHLSAFSLLSELTNIFKAVKNLLQSYMALMMVWELAKRHVSFSQFRINHTKLPKIVFFQSFIFDINMYMHMQQTA